ALSRRHDACAGDWTGLWYRVVLAPWDPRGLRRAEARHRTGGTAPASTIRRSLSGLRPARAAMDLALVATRVARRVDADRQRITLSPIRSTAPSDTIRWYGSHNSPDSRAFT